MNIGIPVINRGDLLEACVASIDAPVERVVIIANRWGESYEPGVETALSWLVEARPACIGSLEIIETGGNLGAAGSYNRAMEVLGPCVVAANDTRFAPGTLARFGEFIGERADHALHFLHGHFFPAYTQPLVAEPTLHVVKCLIRRTSAPAVMPSLLERSARTDFSFSEMRTVRTGVV